MGHDEILRVVEHDPRRRTLASSPGTRDGDHARTVPRTLEASVVPINGHDTRVLIRDGERSVRIDGDAPGIDEVRIGLRCDPRNIGDEILLNIALPRTGESRG